MLFLLAVARAAPLTAGGTLDLDELTREILAANPEGRVADAMVRRARGVAEAASPWPDPMVDLSVAPLSLASMPGWQIEARQDLPLWGTRRAGRAMADADVDAAEAERVVMQLELAEMAAMVWADWYAVHRELALVDASTKVLTEVRASALSRVALGRATQLDVLSAEAELGWLETQGRALATERDVVASRINTLLHRDPSTPVPSPPATLSAPPGPEPAAARPEVAQADAMARAAAAEVDMVRADRLPMLGVMAGWDTMVSMPEDQLMVGVSVQVPLDQASRKARQRAAEAGVTMAQAEVERAADAVALDLAEAERRYLGQVDAVETLRTRLLPVARARVVAARDAFASGTADLRQLLDAERGALDAEIRHEQAQALLHLRARELSIARGHPLPGVRP